MTAGVELLVQVARSKIKVHAGGLVEVINIATHIKFILAATNEEQHVFEICEASGA